MMRSIFYAAAGSFIAVLGALYIWDNYLRAPESLSPAVNYGPDTTWYHMQFHDKKNYQGNNGIDMKLVLGGVQQNVCNNIKAYRDVSDGKSVQLYDNANSKQFLAEGTEVYLYWGKLCPKHKPYGVITVPANVKRIMVPDINTSSSNYQVFNNFDSEDRILASHIFGVYWSAP